MKRAATASWARALRCVRPVNDGGREDARAAFPLSHAHTPDCRFSIHERLALSTGLSLMSSAGTPAIPAWLRALRVLVLVLGLILLAGGNVVGGLTMIALALYSWFRLRGGRH